MRMEQECNRRISAGMRQGHGSPEAVPKGPTDENSRHWRQLLRVRERLFTTRVIPSFCVGFWDRNDRCAGRPVIHPSGRILRGTAATYFILRGIESDMESSGR